jgi:hypothetical protein
MNRRRFVTILALVAVAFAAIDAGLISSLRREYAQALAAATWVPVEAKILSFDAGIVNKRSGSYVTARVRYSYTVKAKAYVGDRMGFLIRDRFDNSAEGMAQVERLARDVHPRAFYDPADPSQSVLSIGHPFAAEYERRGRRLLLGTASGLAVITALFAIAWVTRKRSDRGPNPPPTAGTSAA